MKVDGNLCHDLLRDKMAGKQKLAFKEGCNYDEWRAQVKDKLFELVGIENIKANACPLNFEIESEVQKEGYKQIRFTIESEVGSIVPVYILIPDGLKEKRPVAITLQGHSSGFHNSIGEPKPEEDPDYALNRGKFAVQAALEGYVAVAIEQRGMGERRPDKHNRAGAKMCGYAALSALDLGRTILGERMWDVSKVIDSLVNFDVCDMDNIFITGNSGGGTASFYCACYDERIKFSAPSCAFCSYETSILDIFHCACNHIPHSFEWFEMEDLACLIAPRKLLVIAGQEDGIFPINGVRKSFETVTKIYKTAGVPENCSMVETPKGHYWCEDIVWDSIDKILNEKTI